MDVQQSIPLVIQQKITQKIAKWKSGLADLGRRNPLLKFRKDRSPTVEILTQSEQLFQLLSNNQSISIGNLKTRQTEAELIKSLKKLRLKAKESLEERGVNSLFMAFGTLTWYDTSSDKPEEALTSPLILFPVELLKEPRKEKYSLRRSGEDLSLNPTLALKLRQAFGISFPDDELIQERSYKELFDVIRALLAEQPTWKIQETTHVSLFSYAKAAMIQDLIDNEAQIFSHPILQALAGELTAYQTNIPETINASELDSRIRPELVYQILDADSSQQTVIEAAKTGLSFVVQGPPGTGKSQTIVNMIAELIGMGKSVLLVAEKETALKVVYDRLANCGLEDACLNLHHSGTTDKKALVKNLDATIDKLAQSPEAEAGRLFFERLESIRQTLNTYPASLHTKEQPLDKSPFDLFGELLKRDRAGVPDLNITFVNFSQWSPTQLETAKGLLTRLAQFLPFLKGEQTTIWANSHLTSYSFDLQLQLTEKLEDIQRALYLAERTGDRLRALLGIETPKTAIALEEIYPAVTHLVNVPPIPADWPSAVDIPAARQVFSQLKSDVQVLETTEPSLQRKYLPDLFSPDLPELSARYQIYKRFWLCRLLNSSYREDRKRLVALRTTDGQVSHSELKRDLAQAVQIQALRARLRDPSYPPCQYFGSLFNPDSSNNSALEPIEQALNWLIGLQRYSLPLETVQRLLALLNEDMNH